MRKTGKNIVSISGNSINNIIKTITLNPALLLELEKKGEIKPGYDADIVIFDKNFVIKQVLVT